ncbi:MAG: hypothetical protein Kow0063_03340 [Anaerolineae bacterium]
MSGMVKLTLLSSLIAGITLALGGCNWLAPATTPSSAVQAEPPTYEEMAFHYAPVIHHGVATEQDFITAVDFDGDWVGNNNWQNQPEGDLSAHVYYSVIETETHWFLFYSLFHPRDYTGDPCEESAGCHENDMESIQVVVRKDGTPYGHLLAVETLAHDHIYLYPADPSVGRNGLRLQREATLEDSHPVVYVETYGHGIFGKKIILSPYVVTYRPGERAEVPEGLKDEDVAYRLVPIYDSLWQHRTEVGPGQAFDQPFDYQGHSLPAAFDGDDYGEDRANTPWGYDQETGEALSRGDWFLDPARALLHHAHVEGEISTTYLYNPFLSDLGLMAADR